MKRAHAWLVTGALFAAGTAGGVVWAEDKPGAAAPAKPAAPKGGGAAKPAKAADRAQGFSFSYGLGGSLGADLQPMSADLRAYFGAPADQGVLVGHVEDGSAAARAGMKTGDVLVGVDGKPVDEPWALIEAVASKDAGDELKLEVVRDKKHVGLSVKLGEDDLDGGGSAVIIGGAGSGHGVWRVGAGHGGRWMHGGSVRVPDVHIGKIQVPDIDIPGGVVGFSWNGDGDGDGETAKKLAATEKRLEETEARLEAMEERVKKLEERAK